MASFYQRTGYDVFLRIGGASIPRSWIIGSIKVSKSESQSSLCTFSLLPLPGVQTPENYQGADVTIDIRVAAGVFRIFTGIIDIPELDLINQITTYRCTDDRENKIKSLPLGYIQTFGYFSANAFGVPKDRVEELSKRLSTIPYSMDFDNHGNPTLTPWAPASSPHFTLTPSQVYYIDPRVDFSSRIKTINTVNIQFDYAYQRLHQQELSYSITVYSSLIGWFTGGRGTFPTRDMIKGAASGVGWTLKDEPTYIPLWPAQGFELGGGVVIWQPNQVETQYRNRVDGSGDQVTDVHGNPVQEVAKTTITDTTSNLCLGGSWASYLRFAQNITERYTMTISAPQSVAKYGVILDQESFSTTAEYDNALWEKSTQTYDTEGNFFINQDYNRGDLNNALICVLNKAKTSILAAHRDVNVYFKKFIWPQIDLKHTVRVTTTPLEAKGKVFAIEHEINIQTTEAKTSVTLALSRSQGSASNSALTIPVRPSEATYIGTPAFKTLGVHLGVDIGNYPNANGYFGNIWVDGTAQSLGYKTSFPEAFVVDSPDIPAEIRDTREIQGSGAYTVSIPNDYLIVRY